MNGVSNGRLTLNDFPLQSFPGEHYGSTINGERDQEAAFPNGGKEKRAERRSSNQPSGTALSAAGFDPYRAAANGDARNRRSVRL